MKKKTLKSLVLMLTLVFTLGVFSPVASEALSIKYGHFPDVEKHWAKQVITKMNLRGIVSGYEENSIKVFKPDQDVTQLEAVLMTLRAMGLDDKNKSADVGRYLSFTVPNWAKADVLLAVDNGLIDEKDFTHDKKASRAWVTKLLVKMIDKEAEIGDVVGLMLPFSDTNTIPNDYINYVKLAYKYDLIKGMLENKIAPNEAVTRAQMVAFLSRGEEYVPINDASVILGSLTAKQDGNILVEAEDGADYTLVYNISTNFFDKNDKEISIESLKTGDWLYVIANGNVAQYVGQTKNKPQLTSIKADVLQVYPEENTIVIKDKNNRIETLKLAKTAKIVQEDNRAIDLSKIGKNAQVKISFNAKNEAVRVTLLSTTGISSDADGTIYDLNLDTKLIVIKKDGKMSAYSFNEKTIVNIGKNRLATIEDFRDGDQVKIKAKDDVLEEITLVASEVDLTLEGVVEQVSLEKRIITIKTKDNQLKSFYVDDSVDILFTDEEGQFGDIRAGDKVKARVENGEVKKLTVDNRKLYEKQKGKVVSNDFSNKILTVKDGLGQLQAYEVSEKCDIYVNNKEALLTNIKKDMNLELELHDGKIVYLHAKNTIEGTIEKINDNKTIIDLKLENGDRKSYTVSNRVDVRIEGLSSPQIRDIKKGDIVEVKVRDDRIEEINVKKVINYRVVDTYNSNSKVKVVDENSDRKTLYISTMTELVIPGLDNPRAYDLRLGDTLQGTYLGYNLEKVEKVPVVIGTVEYSNTREKKIDIRGYDGKIHSYDFDHKSKVRYKSSNHSTLAPVTKGDRVVVELNLEGGKTFGILSKVSGKIGSMYKDRTQVYLKQTATTWKKYNMDPTAFLHQGARELVPEDFQADDDVDLYLVDDKVFEVVKK